MALQNGQWFTDNETLISWNHGNSLHPDTSENIELIISLWIIKGKRYSQMEASYRDCVPEHLSHMMDGFGHRNAHNLD